MYFFKLVLRNALRHKLRSLLTMLGIVVAVLAFGLLDTVVTAWYAGANAASGTRLITRNAISLVFPLPLHYRDKIRRIDGVDIVSYANWFAGVYIDEKNFFPQFAVDAPSYFALYPEYLIDPGQWKDFLADRQGAVVGAKLAATFGFKVGDAIPLRGTIHPGTWQFHVRAIYHGAEPKTDTSQFFFHWNYLNETQRQRNPALAARVGVYVIGIEKANAAAEIARAIDANFKNSLAETLTETEKAFQLSFVAMTETILIALRIVSLLVILIILLVMTNTMAMTTRERQVEYATFKALGFPPRFLLGLILGESLTIAVLGGSLGIALTFPIAEAFGSAMGTLFPVFEVAAHTVITQLFAVVAVGITAALFPALRAIRVPVAQGLRSIG